MLDCGLARLERLDGRLCQLYDRLNRLDGSLSSPDYLDARIGRQT